MTSKLAAPSLKVTTEQREALQRISRSHSLPHRPVLQAKALSMSRDGAAIYEVAHKFDVNSNAVRRWRRGFVYRRRQIQLLEGFSSESVRRKSPQTKSACLRNCRLLQ
jgi:hypothetical protein